MLGSNRFTCRAMIGARRASDFNHAPMAIALMSPSGVLPQCGRTVRVRMRTYSRRVVRASVGRYSSVNPRARSGDGLRVASFSAVPCASDRGAPPRRMSPAASRAFSAAR